MGEESSFPRISGVLWANAACSSDCVSARQAAGPFRPRSSARGPDRPRSAGALLLRLVAFSAFHQLEARRFHGLPPCSMGLLVAIWIQCDQSSNMQGRSGTPRAQAPMCQKPSALQARQRDGARRPCARGWRPSWPGGFRVKTAPVVSATGAPLGQFCADETPMRGDRWRSGEIASGSLPFTFNGDRFSAPCNNNNWLGSRPICGPSFGRADPQFNPFEASPAAWRCSSRCGWPRPTSPSVRLMSLRWRQPVRDRLGLGFLDGVQIDQWAELGPLLLDRDQ